jgi:hypothetical protein
VLGQLHEVVRRTYHRNAQNEQTKKRSHLHTMESNA